MLAPLSLTLDQLLFLITAALLCLGLIMVQSADQRIRGLHENYLDQVFHNKNALHAAIALGVMTLIWRLDYRLLMGNPKGRFSILRSPSTWLVFLTMGFLLAVLVTPMGREINGARRWLTLGPGIGFQPSELAKLSLVLFIAAYAVHCRKDLRSFGASTLPLICLAIGLAPLAIKPEKLASIHALDSLTADPTRYRMVQLGFAAVMAALAYLIHRRASLRDWTWGFLPVICIFGASTLLVVKEDFGTTVLIAAVVFIMLMMAGLRWWHLGLLIPPAAAGAYVMLWHSPFRRARLLAFLNPEADSQGAGFHVIQSLLTIANGGLFGRGLGNGIQKMGYLPEDNTDFIFAVICEELGAVGAFMVVGLFAAFVFVGWRIMARTENLFGKMVAFGITAFIGMQAAINLAVVTASMPTKGIALPLISSGGTGWIMNAAAIGVLMSIERVNRRQAQASTATTRAAEPGMGFPIEVRAVPALPVVYATPIVPAKPADGAL